jgi:hypothetical protein
MPQPLQMRVLFQQMEQKVVDQEQEVALGAAFTCSLGICRARVGFKPMEELDCFQMCILVVPELVAAF